MNVWWLGWRAARIFSIPRAAMLSPLLLGPREPRQRAYRVSTVPSVNVLNDGLCNSLSFRFGRDPDLDPDKS